MSSELKLKTNHSPSLLNKDTLLGGLIGALAIGPLGLIGVGVAVSTAAIGGVLGKMRQEHENRDGKSVGEPSIWNKDMAIGGLAGMLGWGIVAVVAVVATMGVAALGGLSLGAIGAAGVMALGAAFVATPLLGAFIGGKIGQSRQASEYEEARQQTVVNHLSATVSPEVGNAVGYAMEHSKEWSKGVVEDRLLAAAQHKSR